MPRKALPFKIQGGLPVAPLGTWSDLFSVGDDTLKRRLAAAGVRWQGRDSYVSLPEIIMAMNFAKQEAEARTVQLKNEEAELKLTERRRKLGELIPRAELGGWLDRRCLSLRELLDGMAVDLSGQLNDPEAEEVIDEYVQGKLLPLIQGDVD